MGVFPNHKDADQALAELTLAGFPENQIELHSPAGVETPDTIKMEDAGLVSRGRAEIGAWLGGIIGLLVGALVGSGAMAGLEQFDAAPGVLFAIAGCVVCALLGWLVGWAVGADHESFYAHELRAGRTVLCVHANGHASEAAAILERHQAARVKLCR
jgi:hypothetical protein